MAATCIPCDCGTDTGHDAMQLLDLALLLAAFLGESICRVRAIAEVVLQPYSSSSPSKGRVERLSAS